MSKPNTAVVLGAQWGDEGKGKIVDVLSDSFQVVARYAGGHDAGHTVTISGKKFVLQLTPCGILRQESQAVIGDGVVLDPFALMKEVDMLRSAGLEVWVLETVAPPPISSSATARTSSCPTTA